MNATARRKIEEGTRFSPTRCIGCGEECHTMTAHMVRASRCTTPKVRPVICRGCLAENWTPETGTTCPHCGTNMRSNP